MSRVAGLAGDGIASCWRRSRRSRRGSSADAETPRHKKDQAEDDEADEQQRQPHDAQPDARGQDALSELDELGQRFIDDGRRIPGSLNRGHGDDGHRPADGERAIAGLIAEMIALGGQLLDLATNGRQLRLDLEDVGDLGRLRHDRLERALGDPQVLDARIKVDDGGGDLDGLGLLVDDLRTQRLEGGQGVVPAIGRDAVGDRRIGLVAIRRHLRAAHVATEAGDRRVRLGERGVEVGDLDAQRTGAHDERVVTLADRLAVLVDDGHGPSRGGWERAFAAALGGVAARVAADRRADAVEDGWRGAGRSAGADDEHHDRECEDDLERSTRRPGLD